MEKINCAISHVPACDTASPALQHAAELSLQEHGVIRNPSGDHYWREPDGYGGYTMRPLDDAHIRSHYGLIITLDDTAPTDVSVLEAAAPQIVPGDAMTAEQTNRRCTHCIHFVRCKEAGILEQASKCINYTMPPNHITIPYIHAQYPTDLVDKGKPMCPIDPATLARLTVLACHMQYEGNRILSVCRGGSKLATKKQIKKILGLQSGTFDRWWAKVWSDRVQSGKYIIGDDYKGYQLMLYAGELPMYVYGHRSTHIAHHVQRLYLPCLHMLYYNGMVQREDGQSDPIRPADHRTIGRILSLLPYLHHQTNVLCSNPRDPSTCIDALRAADIGRILGISPAHIAREIKKLLQLRVSVDVDHVAREMYVMARHEVNGATVYAINPALAYIGTPQDYERIIRSEWL